jgi:SAM-dependent methyltransferase
MGHNTDIARAYDRLAPNYNAQLAQNPVAKYMRAQLQAHLARVFHSGDRVLDFTAGTGIDACFLATRKIAVTALDASPLMIAELQKASADRSLPIEAHVLPAERLNELDAHDFDGAISTFAGLNTIDDLSQLANELHIRLKPGGRLIVHVLNAFCFWQWSVAILRGRPRQRRIDTELGGQLIHHQLYRPHTMYHTYFSPYFDLRSVYGLSIVAAPSIVKRWPHLSRGLFALDRLVGRIFPAAGDFFVIELVRR